MNGKYAIQGIIGCLLFGVGDWLLGYVDPGEVTGDVFYFISIGHGAGYPDWKIMLTMVCAIVGVLFLWQGFVHISDLMKEEKDRAEAARVFTFLTYSWLIIHFVVTIMVFIYSYTFRTIGSKQAVIITNGLDKVMDPCILIAYFILVIAMIDLIIMIVKGKTKLERSDAFMTPLTWMILIGAVSLIIPTSPFSKGLYTFCMNAGMIIWFIRLLVFQKLEKENEDIQ
ncbi:MAG: hypothetical protein K6G27_11050 [Lachnospiraceae bacterium]|nr:hypothetical protein [Lachnospiraceae bacterium]